MQTKFVNPPVWREGKVGSRRAWWYQIGHETYLVIYDYGGTYMLAVSTKITIVAENLLGILEPVSDLWDKRYDVDVECVQKCITDTLLGTVELPIEKYYIERYNCRG